MPLQFATTIYGTGYLHYLGACIASIDHIYDTEAQIIIGYFDIPKETVLAIEKAYPQVAFHEFSPLHTKKNRQDQISLNAQIRARVMKLCTASHIALLDCDTIVRQPLETLFDEKIDVIFTHKTSQHENLNWPINVGVMLARPTAGTRWLYNEYAKLTKILASNKHTRRYSRKKWGAEDQAALGLIIGRKKPKEYERQLTLYGRLLAQHPLKRRPKCIVKGMPCSSANETTCQTLQSSTYIVHYKGRWREVIPDGTFTKYRPAEDCQEMFDLWQANYKRWQERLPNL